MVTMRRNTSLYAPVLTQGKARSAALHALWERAFDGALGPMMHFLLHDRGLSKKERAELRKLLSEQGS